MEMTRWRQGPDATVPAAEKTLGDYLEILYTKRWTVAVAVAAFVALAAAYVARTPTVYRSERRLLIEAPQGSGARRDANDAFNDIYSRPVTHDVATQMEVLQGADLLKRAAAEAGVPPGSVRVSVKRVFDTDVVQLMADSTNRQHAFSMAEALPRAYIRYTHTNEKAGVTAALAFARERLRDDTRRLDRAERDLQRFRDASQITSLPQQRDNRILQASQLSGAVSTAEMNVRGLRDQLAELVSARRSAPKYTDSPTIFTNAAVGTLRERIADLRNERARLLVLYKPSDVRVQEVDARLADLERRLASTPAAVKTSTRTLNPALAEYDKKIAETRAALAARSGELREARATRDGMKADIQRFNELERQEAVREREIERLRRSVALFSDSVERLDIERQTTRPPVVTTSAAAPAEPVAPNAPALLLAALMGGLLFGVCLALVQASLDNRVHSTSEAHNLVGSPVMGFIPALNAGSERALDVGLSAPVLDSYRVLRINMEAAITDGAVKSVLLSSTLRGEGKSLTAAYLAITLAHDGHRVALVDADLRAPSLHALFNLHRSPGLANVLSGNVTLNESMQGTNVNNLWVLTAGFTPSHPAELLNSPAMRDVHRRLRDFVDIVIFDGPPIFGASDALVLAGEADGVLFVVGHGENRRPWLAQSMDLLHQVKANVIGVVMNKVPRRMNPYGYTGAPYGGPAALPGPAGAPSHPEEADPAARNGRRPGGPIAAGVTPDAPEDRAGEAHGR